MGNESGIFELAQRKDQRMKAKKHFGQHFLTSPETAQQIVHALGVLSDKRIVEIGPGKGILTQFLYEQCLDFSAIEIDPEVVEFVGTEWPDLNLINQDVLKTDFESIYGQPFHLIGNFPYNISSQIVFKLIENQDLIQSWVGMFQLEMGKRLLAGPGSKQYGILSVILPFYFKLEEVMVLGPAAFSPPPKVNSIVIKAERSDLSLSCNPKLFKRVVKTAFNQRRKVLSNSLKTILPKETLNQSQFANLRPENLSPQDFEQLSLFIESNVAH